jgi:hypothetical protein
MRRTKKPRTVPQRPLIVIRRDTTGNWEHVNPVLLNGEAGLDYERGVIRIGDGATPWKELKDFQGADHDPFSEALNKRAADREASNRDHR